MGSPEDPPEPGGASSASAPSPESMSHAELCSEVRQRRQEEQRLRGIIARNRSVFEELRNHLRQAREDLHRFTKQNQSMYGVEFLQAVMTKWGIA